MNERSASAQAADLLEKMLNDNPLMLFSIDSAVQFQTLRREANRIRSLDVRAQFAEAHGAFWLWTLGAYELVRTLDQHRDCFEETLAADIRVMKARLARIRIPFAKQELAAKDGGGTVQGETSVKGIDPDGGMQFTIAGVSYSSSTLIGEVIALLGGIQRNRILKRLA